MEPQLFSFPPNTTHKMDTALLRCSQPDRSYFDTSPSSSSSICIAPLVVVHLCSRGLVSCCLWNLSSSLSNSINSSPKQPFLHDVDFFLFLVGKLDQQCGCLDPSLPTLGVCTNNAVSDEGKSSRAMCGLFAKQ